MRARLSRRSGPLRSSAWSLLPTGSAGQRPWCASSKIPSSWTPHANTPPTTTSISAPMTKKRGSHDGILCLRPRRNDPTQGQARHPTTNLQTASLLHENCLHPMTLPGDGRRQHHSGTGVPPQRDCTQKTDPCLETIYFPKSFISRAN